MTSFPAPFRDDGRWLYLPGNIPSLYEFCRTAIRNDPRLRDAVLLTPDLLPDSVADDVLDDDGDRRVVNPPSPFLVPSSDCVEGSCPTGFFPRSAAFLDETTAVVLGNDGGTCCARRAVVAIERGGVAGDVRWISPPSRVPGTIPSGKGGGLGGGVRSENVSLRADGSAVWIARDALHVAPPSDDDAVSRMELRFATKGPPAPSTDDVVVVLPDVVPSREAFFAIGRRKSKAGEGRWDLLEIHAETGEVRGVSAAEGTATGAERRGFRPSNLVERSDGELIVIVSERGQECPEIYQGSVQRDGNGAPVGVQWSLETRVEGSPNDGSHRALRDVRLVRSSERDGICAAMGGSREPRPWLCVSGGAEEGWGLAENSQMLTNGIGGYPPALAFSPSGDLFAFAYEAQACQRAERKHILRLKTEWPLLSVYKWSKRLYERRNCQR